MPDPSDADGALSLTLGPELTIAQAADTHGVLLAAIQQWGGPLMRLELSTVSDCDSAGIQLLLATRRSAMERGAQLELLQPSAVVLSALQCYGLDAQLHPIRRARGPAASLAPTNVSEDA